MKRESVVVRARRERERKTAERKTARERRKSPFISEIKDVSFTVAYFDRGTLYHRIESKTYKGDE